ncbi:MAG: hypothetical protein JSS74_07025 [Actinobacteria bacterium]|nr:hypothetical protein [Actinomycetota bacterium]
MILWFTIVQLAVAVSAGLFCLILGFAGRRPSDWSVGALALVELLLIVQVVMAIVSPFVGNPALGDPLEYGVYLVAAVLLPIGGALWALLERSRWSTVIMGVVALSLAVMIWRMQVIWMTPVGL